MRDQIRLSTNLSSINDLEDKNAPVRMYNISILLILRGPDNINFSFLMVIIGYQSQKESIFVSVNHQPTETSSKFL
jgi:hypothetical protein